MLFFLKLNSMSGDEYSGLVYYGKEGIVYSKKESELISENIRRIILTKKGERVGEPNFGSNVKMFLFMPQIFIEDVIEEIRTSIEAFEPRVKVLSCTLTSAGQDDVVNIDLKVEIISSNTEEDITIEVKV